VCCTIQCYQYGNDERTDYEYFRWVIGTDVGKQKEHDFEPNSDWSYTEFRHLIKAEWDEFKQAQEAAERAVPDPAV